MASRRRYRRRTRKSPVSAGFWNDVGTLVRNSAKEYAAKQFNNVKTKIKDDFKQTLRNMNPFRKKTSGMYGKRRRGGNSAGLFSFLGGIKTGLTKLGADIKKDPVKYAKAGYKVLQKMAQAQRAQTQTKTSGMYGKRRRGGNSAGLFDGIKGGVKILQDKHNRRRKTGGTWTTMKAIARHPVRFIKAVKHMREIRNRPTGGLTRQQLTQLSKLVRPTLK